MENPDAELEIKRDEHGFILGLAYKVSNPGDENHRAREFCQVSCELVRTEGPGDKVANIDADIHVGE